MNSNFIELNEANFHREVLSALQPVLVEYWAGWSEAIKVMAPLLETVAKDDAVPVKIVRVNVEHHENLTDQYGVRAVPTLLHSTKARCRIRSSDKPPFKLCARV